MEGEGGLGEVGYADGGDTVVPWVEWEYGHRRRRSGLFREDYIFLRPFWRPISPILLPPELEWGGCTLENIGGGRFHKILYYRLKIHKPSLIITF